MRILQAGVAKSGNYWVYQLLTAVQREAGLPERRFIRNQALYADYRTWPHLSFPEQPDVDFLEVSPRGYFYEIPDVLVRRIEDLDAYLSQSSHVWTHSPIDDAHSPYLFEKMDRVVYIVRDPRDVAISLSHFAFAPYAAHYWPASPGRDPAEYLERNLDSILHRWVAHVAGHLELARAHNLYLLRYERLRLEFDAELDALLAYLGLDLEPARRQRVREAVGYGSMKAASPNHVRAGQANGWVKNLTDGQKFRAVEIAGPLLDLLGYPRALPVA